MDNNYMNYFREKTIQAFTFDADFLKEFFENDSENMSVDNEFVEKLYVYIDYMAKNNFLEHPYKENLYELINYLKINFNSKHQITEVLNEMIIKLNCSDGSKCDDFYLFEMKKRIKNFANVKKDYEMYKEILIYSLAADYHIFICHTADIKDEEFDNSFLPNFYYSLEYFYCINAFISELGKDVLTPLMIERINKMLNFNKKHNDKKENILKFRIMVRQESRLFQKGL